MAAKKNELNLNDSVYIAESSSLSFIYRMCMHEGSENNAWDQNRRELIMNEQPLMGMSSRWSPTPEQLLALEEMYRRGTRTPKAEQIQQIAAQLRRFGKIEGKNVFYWFQNHKARERQKRRRAVEASRKVLKHDITGSLDMKESVELQKKTLVPPSSCSENLEGPVSILTAGTTESTTSHGCLQIEKRESNQCKSCSLEKKTKWLAVDPCPYYPTHLINNMTTRSSRFLNSQRQSSWFKSNRRTENDENKIGEVETLDLFPLCSEDCSGVNGSKNDTEVAITAINTKMMSPNQYFEFLPLKN